VTVTLPAEVKKSIYKDYREYLKNYEKKYGKKIILKAG